MSRLCGGNFFVKKFPPRPLKKLYTQKSRAPFHSALLFFQLCASESMTSFVITFSASVMIFVAMSLRM